METPHVDWSYSGDADPLLGTGATLTERLFGYGFASLITTLLVVIDQFRTAPIATSWRILVYIFLSFDIAGGAAVNMLNSCKRFYHSPVKPEDGAIGKILKNSQLFTGLHVQPIIAAWTLGEDWANVLNAVIWYVILQIGVLIVRKVPLYLKRGVAAAIVITVLVTNGAFLSIGDGLDWFIPSLFLKLALAHAVREEPYRPPIFAQGTGGGI